MSPDLRSGRPEYGSGAFLAKLLANVGEVVTISDAAGVIHYVSPNVERHLGWRPGDLVGRRIHEMIHADHAADVTALAAGILERPGVAASRDLRLACPDGESRWVDYTGVNLLDDEDVSGILGTWRDITSRKVEEDAVARSRDLLTNLARLVPGVIYQYRLDPDGRSAFPYSSPGMNDIYEVSPEDVREDASPVFGRLHPDDIADVSARIVESARSLQIFQCEFRVVLPRQGLRWRWSQAFPERTPAGGTLWHGIILDITERKEAEVEREKLQFELAQSQKMESVGRLAGGVAHDFNNMLSVIIGRTEILLGATAGDGPLHEDLAEVAKAAERSAALTKQLLAFARKQTVTRRVVDLNDTIAGMLAMLRRLIGEGITLEWKPAGGPWPVLADPAQVDQILANLCVNARDAIAGVGTVLIETGGELLGEDFCAAHKGANPGKHVRLSVTDTGSGMDAEALSHLFEPFYTTKPVGGGTGLGLSTIYGIIEQNGWTIDVRSAPGQGTCFSIYLPLRHEEPVEDGPPPAVLPQVHVDDAVILVVEDEPLLLEMATVMLEKGGYTVLAANGPGQAIETARNYPDEIHLLLTDVIMPDMNGRELARRLREVRPGLRHLYMSGYTADVLAPQGVLDEGVFILEKPFTRQAMIQKVKEALGVRLRVW